MVLFVLTHVPDPRMNKRIEALKQLDDVSVICVRRKTQDIYESNIEGVTYHVIDMDMPPIKQIIKRMVISKKFQMIVSKLLKEINPTCIYCEGLDVLIEIAKYKAYNKDVKVIYEVADLREIFIEDIVSIKKKVQRVILEIMEKKGFVCVDNLVITSEKFYEKHYYKLISKDKVIFLPNMPELKFFSNYKKKNAGPFTVGFIGGIRYLEQMKMLVDAAEEAGVNVFFAGAGGTDHEYDEINTYCKGKNHVRFTGKYNYEKDIASIYGMVDCVYAVYDAGNPNVRIALPNKLYEAVYCELPIIVAKGTYLQEVVEQWGVGVAVGHKDKTELSSQLKDLAKKRERYMECVLACREQKHNINNDACVSKLSAGLIG